VIVRESVRSLSATRPSGEDARRCAIACRRYSGVSISRDRTRASCRDSTRAPPEKILAAHRRNGRNAASRIPLGEAIT